MTPDVENLAAGLSEAQRRAIMTAVKDGADYRLTRAPAYLISLGLAWRNEGKLYLTETGLQLRTYLESRTRGEGEL